jgi:hypothetical protein
MAFTLIEVMVAVALLSFIIVGLLAMFYYVQRAFKSGVTNSDVMEGGRAVMSQITRDLQEAAAVQIAFTTNLAVQPAAGSTTLWGEVTTQQDLPSGEKRVNFLQDLSFFSQANGDWAGINYRIVDAPTGLGTLYRSILTTNYDSNPYVASNALYNLVADSFRLPIDSPVYSRILDGVVHFAITAYDTNGNYFTNATFANGSFAFTNKVMPAYLDIELGILEPPATERFRANLDVGGTAAQNYLRRQVGRTHLFRQRVGIRPAATPTPE